MEYEDAQNFLGAGAFEGIGITRFEMAGDANKDC